MEKACPLLLAGLLSNPVIVCDDGNFRESFVDKIDYDCLKEDCKMYIGYCGLIGKK